MVYTPHEPVKAEKLVNTYVGLVDRQLLIPQLFARKGIDEFRGAEGDAVTVKVPGRVPARRYAFRNDRSQPIKFDVYKENRVTTTFGDRIYSALKITDEQVDFDGLNAQGLLPVQSRAVASELNGICTGVLSAAPFPVVIGGVAANPKRGLIEARKVAQKIGIPGRRVVLMGSDFEAELLDNDRLNLASNAGDKLAENAFARAVLGERFGFTFLAAPDLAPDTALVVFEDPAILLTGAPYVPASAPKGATTSYEGLALRWIQDYDTEYMTDRSVVDTYCGTQLVKDVFLKWDNTTLAGDTTHGGEVVGEEQHFVRAFKLTLAGASTGPTAGSALAQDTGLVDAEIWDGADTP